MTDDLDRDEWISPGAAHRIRRLTWALMALVVLLGVNSVFAWDARNQAVDARDSGRAETSARIAANTENARKQCMALDDVARASKAVVAGTGASLTQADVDRITDPQLHALVQGIVDRSAANQQRLRDLGAQIPILDCDAQTRATRSAGGTPTTTGGSP